MKIHCDCGGVRGPYLDDASAEDEFPAEVSWNSGGTDGDAEAKATVYLIAPTGTPASMPDKGFSRISCKNKGAGQF